MRIAVIDYELCRPEKCGFLCYKVCPINLQGKECIKKVEMMVEGSMKERPVIVEELCIGCGICVRKCPFGAIKIVNTPETLDERPIHRYGRNGFVLFRLPIPVRGVVGILGENGLGKSTALKILSGHLKPNLGGEADWEEIIRVHRGNEIQPYLEKLAEGKINAIYKPQNLAAVKKAMAEKKVGELGIEEEWMERFQLKGLEERRIGELSGGELQRLLICLALRKEADIYLIDEPTSYLDIYQRLKMGMEIRKRGEESMAVVIDHDLATLDFLADRIHIFYGSRGAFGIVSKPYSVRNGINAFIEGYIKEDNVRIHEPIRFSDVSSEIGEGEEVAEVGRMAKRFEGFELEVEGHKIYPGITGILGRNGLGKTTYLNLLSGKVDPDEGEGLEMKFSYKEQFISPEEGTVKEFLGHMDSGFRNLIASPLGIEGLMEREMKNLSGGELQRVMIAKCLKEEADIYLLDEPSAFLDVRQRLAVAKVLRDFSASHPVMVVDHDLLLISQISDRLMLFTGIPGKKGRARIVSVKEGMNEFLKAIGMTFRRDPETKRPRANKPNSQKDREQKMKGIYYEG